MSLRYKIKAHKRHNTKRIEFGFTARCPSVGKVTHSLDVFPGKVCSFEKFKRDRKGELRYTGKGRCSSASSRHVNTSPHNSKHTPWSTSSQNQIVAKKLGSRCSYPLPSSILLIPLRPLLFCCPHLPPKLEAPSSATVKLPNTPGPVQKRRRNIKVNPKKTTVSLLHFLVFCLCCQVSRSKQEDGKKEEEMQKKEESISYINK